MDTFGHVEAAFLHHNFTARGKEQFSDALKQVLKENPEIPIICWGKVAKGGTQGKDFVHGLEWDAKAGEQPILKCLHMLKSGHIGAGRNSIDANSPRGSIDLQPQMGPMSGNVRRSIDMNSNSSLSERRVSISSPRQSVEMMPAHMMMPNHMMMAPQGMVPQGVMAPSSLRRSMDMSPYAGSPLHASSSQVASPLSHPQLEVQPSAGSQGQVIKALADEVQRLRILVEEKRAREKAAA